MTITLGRVGTDISLVDPQRWDRDGNTVTLSGWASNASVANATTLTEQLLGLADNPDEPVIACTWTYESWFDGYYRVRSVAVPGDPERAPLGDFRYTIVLERVADGASPTIDVSLLGALRTNGNSVTTGRANSWAPSAMQGGYARGGVFTIGTASVAYNQSGSAQSRTTETGAVISVQTTGASAVSNAYGNFDVGVSDYYDGHCTIRSGTVLRRVVGSRMKTLPVNWEVSNGLIRVTPGATSTLTLEVFDGSAWEDSKSFMFTHGSATSNQFAASTGWGDVSVVRNSPECVSIRLRPGFTGGHSNAAYHLDVTLQRGRYFADITVVGDTDPTSAGTAYGFGCVTAEAATAITGGIRATSNDAAGNRYVLATASPSGATTNNLTQGHVSNAALTNVATFMVGYELAGSGSAAPNTAQNIVDEWYYPIEERMAPRTR